MNEQLTSEVKRGRPYKVLVCFVTPAEKPRYVRGAKMKRGRTISRFIQEAMELLMRVEERLLSKIEQVTYEYAENEYLDAQFRSGAKAPALTNPSSVMEVRKAQTEVVEQERKPREVNPILQYIEARMASRS